LTPPPPPPSAITVDLLEAALPGVALDQLGGFGPEWYIIHEIPKRDGTTRKVYQPKPPLDSYQRAIHTLLDQHLDHTLSPYATAFRSGSSPLKNATMHAGARMALQVDIKDFFNNTMIHLENGLRGVEKDALRVIAMICTSRRNAPRDVPLLAGTLAPGLPSSPVLSNLACRDLDVSLGDLARGASCYYTRYADDITFSRRDVGPLPLLVDVEKELERYGGYMLNPSKTRVCGPGDQIVVTGYLVNPGNPCPRLPRNQWKRLRGMLHQLAEHPDPKFREKVEGLLAFARQADPEKADKVSGE
jgi:hypothetical protein